MFALQDMDNSYTDDRPAAHVSYCVCFVLVQVVWDLCTWNLLWAWHYTCHGMRTISYVALQCPNYSHPTRRHYKTHLKVLEKLISTMAKLEQLLLMKKKKESETGRYPFIWSLCLTRLFYQTVNTGGMSQGYEEVPPVHARVRPTLLRMASKSDHTIYFYISSVNISN